MIQSEDKTLLPPLTVETLVNGGSGLARHDGRVVFIPHTAVGDRVRCRVVAEKKRYFEAEVVELLESGPGRRVPPCSAAGQCGGCQWQHLEYDTQCQWKQKLFRETLIHQCRIDPELILPLVPAPEEWHYRSRVQLKCFNNRDGFHVGFYRSKSRYVIDVDDCHLVMSPFNMLMKQCRSLFSGTDFAAQIPQIDLAAGCEGRPAVTVHYIGESLGALTEHLLMSELDADMLIQNGTKRTLKVVRGSGSLQIHVSSPKIVLEYAVGSFAQINLTQNRHLVDYVVRLADTKPGDRVVDLFCGMGNFSLPLARSGAEVTGIEESRPSIRQARQNAKMNGLSNSRFICGRAEDKLAQIGREPVDLVLLDPPRSGAHALMKSLLQLRPQRIIYVSCDPQTLARDLKVLLNGPYRVVSTRPFDMFPQTYHCESVTLLQSVS